MKRPTAVEWADFVAGRLPAARRRELSALAEGSADARAALERARRVHAALSDIAETSAPDLSWDHIRARIHWEVSHQRRRRRLHAPPWRAVVAGLALVGVVGSAGMWLAAGRGEPARGASSPVAASAGPEAAVTTAAEPAALAGLVTLVEGDGMRSGQPLGSGDLDAPVRAGDRLTSGEGRIAVQFGSHSAFEIGPRSTLTVQRFDDGGIELAIDGSIDVEVAHRKPGQTFVVTTERGRVEVRGTRFRVETAADSLVVSCTRGEVAAHLVSGQDAEVPAGHRLTDEGPAPAVVKSLEADELRELDDSLRIPELPVWDPDWNRRSATSSILAALEPRARLIAVDGIEIGVTPLRVRVMPGRHHVASEEGAGWSQGSWIELDAREEEVAALAVPGVPPRHVEARSRRRAELRRAIARSAAVQRCVRGMSKRGLAEGAYVDLDIGILADGTQRYLNIVGSDLPPPVRSCVRDAIDRLHLGTGAAVSLRHRVRF